MGIHMEITQTDLKILKEHHKTILVKCYLYHMFSDKQKTVLNTNYKPIGNLEGEITDGSFSMDASSDIRRTLSLSLFVKDSSLEIGEDKKIWLDKLIGVQIGIEYGPKQIRWYPLGIFVLKNANYNYSEDTNELSLECSDLTCLLNGERGGIVRGAKSVLIESGATVTPVVTDIIQFDYAGFLLTHEHYTMWNDDILLGFTIHISKKFQPSSSKNSPPVYINVNNLGYLPLVDSDLNPIRLYKLENDKPYSFKYTKKVTGNEAKEYLIFNEMNTIQGAMESCLRQFGGIAGYNIASIGSTQTATQDNPYPCLIPYDLNFDCGTSVYEIITTLRDLYSGYDTYFDENGIFICDEIPNGADEGCLFDETVLEELVISEQDSYDLTSIRNITEIWGKSLDTHHYCPLPALTADSKNRILKIALPIEYYATDEQGNQNQPYTYISNELIGFTCPDISGMYSRNILNSYRVQIKINDLEYMNLIQDYTSGTPVTVADLLDNTGYCFKPNYSDTNSIWHAIFYGAFEVHAVDILRNTLPASEEMETYRKQFNCNNIHITRIPDARFSVEKCGELHCCLSGGEYENIYTADLARQRAIYENWKSARFTDGLTVTTILIPFLDVNRKIKYKSKRTKKTDTYLINKVSFSFSDFTTTIEMRKYYSAYPELTT
ncbi:MAG: DUF5048 domain-containing protein [Lachnospiraceae bacterium]|nr:DUF5048 domain-containing protein [Lachnospiraceae bacterium]